MYYTQEQIDRANQADLVLFLQSQGEQLERAGQEYRWKRHDSLTVWGNKWYRHSQSKGGGPVDFVMEFFGRSFTEAVELLAGEKGAAPPPDRPSSAPLSDFRLPPRSPDNCIARNYLTAARRIDEDVTGFFFATGDIYEEAAHHNAVFVGRDESGIPRYAHQRGTAGNFRLDVKGSDKAFNFCYRGEGDRLFVFEAPVDLLSFLCLFKKAWQKQSYLALGGVGEKALLRFLSDRPNIKTVYLCLDSDQAGNDACSRLAELVPEGLTVHRLVPLYKDWNEVLQHRAEITDGKYLREAIYGLKAPESFCNTKDKKILSQVLNNYDQETTDFYRWKIEYKQDELSELILKRSGIDYGQILDLIPVERGTSGRLVKLKIRGSKRTMTIGKELEIRRTLSTSHLYSSAFVIDKADIVDDVPGRFILTGAGWGHGVGLCQIGAAVMGEQGYPYDTILLHYYIGATIDKLY